MKTRIHVIPKVQTRKSDWGRRTYTYRTWAVRIEGAKGVSKMFYQKRMDACFWAAGRLLQAGGGELIVHDRNGEVEETWEIAKTGWQWKGAPE